MHSADMMGIPLALFEIAAGIGCYSNSLNIGLFVQPPSIPRTPSVHRSMQQDPDVNTRNKWNAMPHGSCACVDAF